MRRKKQFADLQEKFKLVVRIWGEKCIFRGNVSEREERILGNKYPGICTYTTLSTKKQNLEILFFYFSFTKTYSLV